MNKPTYRFNHQEKTAKLVRDKAANTTDYEKAKTAVRLGRAYDEAEVKLCSA